MSKVTIHMVSSLDGFISSPDQSTSWMQSKDTFENGTELTEEYIAEFLSSIDCYVMGSKTYEHALNLGWPYGDTPVIVLTSRDLTSNKESVQFYSGDLKELIEDQLKPFYQNIWMVGGSITTKEFIEKDLADEIVITVAPVILGDGILFFDSINKEKTLHLIDVMAFKDGMIEMTYEILKN
ncbi:dihydrofolate reductase family protein [Ekhidna sp.]